MPENSAPIDSRAKNELPSTDGMAEKVITGSVWTLVGTILPLAITFFSTPFVVRFLGSEAYGVLILVGLIPNYFHFADFGMGVASTKFGSEAYASGSKQKEGETVRTAALIALIFALPIGIGLFLFSNWIINALKVPQIWHVQASVGLKITSIAFIVGIFSGIFNTPQLSRLRMDLNARVNLVPKVLLPIVTVVVLYFGGGIIGAAWVTLFAAIVGLIGHIFFSGRLLPALYRLSIDSSSIKPLLKFGGSLLIALIAVTSLINLEKFFFN